MGSGNMVIRKIRDQENPLLYRKEYIFAVIHDAQSTPARKKLREEIAKLLGVDQNMVVVRRIKTDFGTNTSKVEVH
ncbi:MAG: 30S ribosomal protein S24e, partial [Candidatus Njordarchaeota archaeon]